MNSYTRPVFEECSRRLKNNGMFIMMAWDGLFFGYVYKILSAERESRTAKCMGNILRSVGRSGTMKVYLQGGKEIWENC